MHISITDSLRSQAYDHYQAGFSEVAYGGNTRGGTAFSYVIFPTRNVKVGGLTLYGFLRKLDEHFFGNPAAARDVILVSHGNSTQVSLDLASGIPLPVTAELCDDLCAWVEDLEKEVSSPRVPKWSADHLKWADDNGLMDYLRLVRDARPGHIALRSCNVGSSAALLRSLKKLLNCQGVSAPKVLDSFVSYRISYQSELSYLRWCGIYPRNGCYRVPGKKMRAQSGGEVFIEVYLNIPTFSSSGHAMWVQDVTVLNAWLKEKFHAPPAYSGGDLVLHALRDSDVYYFPLDAGFAERISLVGY